jgi:hypothetical protein
MMAIRCEAAKIHDYHNRLDRGKDDGAPAFITLRFRGYGLYVTQRNQS